MAKNLIPSLADMDAPSESELLEQAHDILLDEVLPALRAIGEDDSNPIIQKIIAWNKLLNTWLEQ